jgi:hypothetical protein
MAGVKVITGANGLYGPWDIYANNVTINGNIAVVGNISYFNASLTTVGNSYITVNAAETGAGITGGNAGILIDRGISPNAFWIYNELYSAFTGNISGNIQRIQAASPVANSDVVTLQFLSNSSSGATAVGPITSVQYNQGGGLLLGNANFTYDNTNLNVYGTQIANAKITTNGTNQDLRLYGNGAGVISISQSLKFNFKNITPSIVSNNTLLFSNTVGGGGTGLYVVNSNSGNELIGKNRTIGFYLMI